MLVFTKIKEVKKSLGVYYNETIRDDIIYLAIDILKD